jgi:Yip1 domain
MDNFKEFVPDEDVIEDNKIVETVLLDPKRAFKFIHKYRYENHLKALLVLGGISGALDRAATNNSGDNMSLGGVIGMAVIFGGLLGWISYYIYAGLISWTGGWLNGRARTSDVLRILAYAYLPAVFSLVLIIIQIAIFGNSYFQSYIDLDAYGITGSIIYYGCSMIEFGLAIWSIFLLVIGVAEAQKFNYGKALFNVVLPLLIIVVPIVLIFIALR